MPILNRICFIDLGICPYNSCACYYQVNKTRTIFFKYLPLFWPVQKSRATVDSNLSLSQNTPIYQLMRHSSFSLCIFGLPSKQHPLPTPICHIFCTRLFLDQEEPWVGTPSELLCLFYPNFTITQTPKKLTRRKYANSS